MPRVGGTDPRSGGGNRNPGFDGVFNTIDDILGSPGIIQSDSNNDYVPSDIYGFKLQVTGRIAPSAINAAFESELFWDGRAGAEFSDPVTGEYLVSWGGALENQAVGPPMSSVEMSHAGRNWPQIINKLSVVNPLDLATNLPPDIALELAGNPSYPELFQRAFGTTEITAGRIAFAIATYERTLISSDTPYDHWRAGDPNAMTPSQIEGFNTFTGPGSQCTACHFTVNDLFTNHGYHNLGVRPPAEDRGRQLVTGRSSDRGKFRTPGLRNVGLHTRFMHDGSQTSLEQVIKFYARTPGAPTQYTENLDGFMTIINLPESTHPALVDFLRNALTDPRVANETYPFDRPTLFAERGSDRVMPIITTSGNAGTGGFTPGSIISSPPMIGDLDFRIGLQNALAGAPAMLAVSFGEPIDGQISPDYVVFSSNSQGIGAGGGYATAHISLDVDGPFGVLQAGDVLYAQWFVTDPAAAGGTAYSQVLRIPVFCGSYGCPTVCIADVDHSGGIDASDLGLFFTYFETGDDAADLDLNGGIDGGDIATFINAYEAGC
jgi:cytochrome c peroxidase